MPLGISVSGFRAEVEAEQALARGEHLLALIDKHVHQHLAGPAASEAAQRLGWHPGRSARRGGRANRDQLSEPELPGGRSPGSLGAGRSYPSRPRPTDSGEKRISAVAASAAAIGSRYAR